MTMMGVKLIQLPQEISAQGLELANQLKFIDAKPLESSDESTAVSLMRLLSLSCTSFVLCWVNAAL